VVGIAGIAGIARNRRNRKKQGLPRINADWRGSNTLNQWMLGFDLSAFICEIRGKLLPFPPLFLHVEAFVFRLRRFRAIPAISAILLIN